MFMFETEDRDTGKKMEDAPENIDAVKARLRSDNSVGMEFITADKRTILVAVPLKDDGKISLRIRTIIGRERLERWPLSKLELQLESGFLTEKWGELHDRWIENSKPRPLSPEAKEFLEKHPITINSIVSAIAKIYPETAAQLGLVPKPVPVDEPEWQVYSYAATEPPSVVWRRGEGEDCLFDFTKGTERPKGMTGTPDLDRLLADNGMTDLEMEVIWREERPSPSALPRFP